MNFSSAPRILLVDDNPLILNVLEGLFVSAQFDVEKAENGKRALDLMESNSYDLIVCDVMMPKMDGYKLHELLRQKKDYHHVPFVFLTALDDHEEICRGHSIGADAYVTKPFEPEELLSIVLGKLRRASAMRSSTEEQQEKFKKKVLHTLSHEFRTPLVAINTGAEILLSDMQDETESENRTLVEAIHRGGLRLQRTVNDFLLMQQIDSGLAERVAKMHARPVKVDRLLTQLRNSMDPDLTAEGFTLAVRNGSIAEVSVAEEQVVRSMEKIVQNSIKFAGSTKNVEIEARDQGGETIIDIMDRGQGFDPEKIQEALRMFGQLDREKQEQQGSGLGLAIAQRLASINGGRLEFMQRSGGGSTVRIIFPSLPASS